MKRRDFLSGLLALPFMAAFASKFGFASGGIVPPWGIHRGNTPLDGNPFTVSCWLKEPGGSWNRVQWSINNFPGGRIPCRMLGYQIEDIGHPLLLCPGHMVQMSQLDGETTHEVIASVSRIVNYTAVIECEISLLTRDGVFIYEPSPPLLATMPHGKIPQGTYGISPLEKQVKRIIMQGTIKGYNRNV